MKIADFFVQITAKGDLKEIKVLADAQKAMSAMAKKDIAQAKVKIAELQKQTAELKTQATLEAKKLDIAQKEPLIKAKTITEGLKAKAKSMQITKAEAKEEEKKPKTLKETLIAQGKLFDKQMKMNMLIGKGVLQTMGLAGGFIAAAVAIDKMVQKLAQANQAYINFQRQTGISMGAAQGMSAAMAGVDVTMSPEEVMQNMQNLQNNLIGIQFGQGNIAPYQMAGINPMGANFDTIRRQLRGFAPAYRTYLLQQMGLDPRLGALIDLSDKEYADMKAEQSMLYLDPQVRKDIQIIGVEVNKMFLAMKKMKDLIVVILGHLARPVTAFLKMALNTVNIILEGIAKMPTLLKTIEVIVISIMTWITRGLIWLIPILEDLAVWASGGKSLFKELFENPSDTMSRMGETIKGWFSGDFWANLKNTIIEALKGAFQPSSEGNSFGLIGKDPLSWLTKLLMGDIGKDINNAYKNNPYAYHNQKASIEINNDIHVGSAADGYAMIQPLRESYNNAVALLQPNGGYA